VLVVWEIVKCSLLLLEGVDGALYERGVGKRDGDLKKVQAISTDCEVWFGGDSARNRVGLGGGTLACASFVCGKLCGGLGSTVRMAIRCTRTAPESARGHRLSKTGGWSVANFPSNSGGPRRYCSSSERVAGDR